MKVIKILLLIFVLGAIGLSQGIDPAIKPYLETQEMIKMDMDTAVVDVKLSLGALTTFNAIISDTTLIGIAGEDTLVYVSMYMMIDTEAAAVLDTIETITGGADGDLLILRTTVLTRDVFFDDGQDNVHLSADFTLTDTLDVLVLQKRGISWVAVSEQDNN